jgi:hypothetical protein
LRNSQFESSTASSGYRPASLQLAPSIDLSASPSNQPPTCVVCLSPAMPSNRNFQSFIDCQILQQVVRSIFQLAPSTNRLTQPSRQPLTCVSSQPSGSAFVSACNRRRLPNLQPCPPIAFQLALSVDLPAQPSSQPVDLRLLVDLPALLPNLTSDSRRRSYLLALPSN